MSSICNFLIHHKHSPQFFSQKSSDTICILVHSAVPPLASYSTISLYMIPEVLKVSESVLKFFLKDKLISSTSNNDNLRKFSNVSLKRSSMTVQLTFAPFALQQYSVSVGKI